MLKELIIFLTKNSDRLSRTLSIAVYIYFLISNSFFQKSRSIKTIRRSSMENMSGISFYDVFIGGKNKFFKVFKKFSEPITGLKNRKSVLLSEVDFTIVRI